MTRRAVLSVLVLTLVVGIAAWSKLRYVGREGYDEPQRWRVQDYPGFKDGNHARTAGRGSATAGG